MAWNPLRPLAARLGWDAGLRAPAAPAGDAWLAWALSLAALGALEALRPLFFLTYADAVGALPRLSQAFGQLEHGHFPWWDPYGGLGRPLFEAGATGILDPLLYAARGLVRALGRPLALFDLQALLGLPLAAAALHRLLRRLNVERYSALAAALAWVLLVPGLLPAGPRGPALALACYGPWLALALLGAAQGGFGAGWALGAALLRLACFLAGGSAALLPLVGLELAALAAWSWRRGSLRLLGMGLASLLLSAGLIAPAALLTWDAARLTSLFRVDGETAAALAVGLALTVAAWATSRAAAQPRLRWAMRGLAIAGLVAALSACVGGALAVAPQAALKGARPAPLIAEALQGQPFLAVHGAAIFAPAWVDGQAGGLAGLNSLRSLDAADAPAGPSATPAALAQRYGLSRVVVPAADAALAPGLRLLTRTVETLVFNSGVDAWDLKPVGCTGVVKEFHYGGGAALRADLDQVSGGAWLLQVPWRPGLRAKADGHAIGVIEGADGWAQLAVPAGATALRVDYRPPGLRWILLAGLGLALLGLGALGLAVRLPASGGKTWVA